MHVGTLHTTVQEQLRGGGSCMGMAGKTFIVIPRLQSIGVGKDGVG